MTITHDQDSVKRRDLLKRAAPAALVTSAALVVPQTAKAAVITQASWVHGSSVQIEWPNVAVNVRRTGTGIHVEGQANWLHIAVPTPVICSDRRLCITRAGFSFRVPSGAYVRHLHVYDGPTRIAAFSPNFTAGHSGTQLFTITPRLMTLGVGLSLYFDPGVAAGAYIEIYSGGADFN
jgi:hypothetical protein